MTLAVYPLVFLPVAAAFRGADPALEEVGRSLGLGPPPDLRPGDAAPGPPGPTRGVPAGGPGPAGRVRGLRDPQVPDLHHRDLHRVPGGLRHAGGVGALAGPGGAQPARARRRGAARAGGRTSRSGPQSPGGHPPTAWAGPPSRPWSAGCPGRAGRRCPGGRPGLLAGEGASSTLPGSRRCSAAAGTRWPTPARPPWWPPLAALPVALVAVRHRSRSTVLARAQHLRRPGAAGPGHRPGPVFFSVRYAVAFYQSTPAAGAWPTPSCSSPWPWWRCGRRWPRPRVGLEEVGRSLGAGPVVVLVRVTLPLSVPGLARRLLPGVPVGGYRAHGHPGADPHRGADPGHPVLGVPDQPVLRAAAPFAAVMLVHRRRAQRPPRAGGSTACRRGPGPRGEGRRR